MNESAIERRAERMMDALDAALMSGDMPADVYETEAQRLHYYVEALYLGADDETARDVSHWASSHTSRQLPLRLIDGVIWIEEGLWSKGFRI